MSDTGPGDRARREFEAFPLHKAMGLSIEEVRPGFARLRMRTSEFTLGGARGSVHGGLLAALVDIAMLQALIPMFRPNEAAAGTADLNITYMRPAMGPCVFAEATVLRKGRHLAVVEVSITGEDGQLCARGRTIYAIQPLAGGS